MDVDAFGSALALVTCGLGACERDGNALGAVIRAGRLVGCRAWGLWTLVPASSGTQEEVAGLDWSFEAFRV